MSPLLVYFLKSSLLLIVFYSFYKIVLQGETWYRFNRFYLLATVFLSAFLPLIQIPEPVQAVPGISFMLGEVLVRADKSAEPALHVPVDTVLWWFYLGGVFLLLLRLTSNFLRLLRLKSRSGILENTPVRVYQHTGIPSSFSFLRWIFLDKHNLDEKRIRIILLHEQAHIRQWHSLDLIVAEVFKAVFWFHPLAWFLQKALQEIHEYLADREVLRAGTYASEYMGVLMQQIDLSHPIPMSNHFNQSLLKRRFTMITKLKSGPVRALKAGLLLPVLLFSCACILFSIHNPSFAQEAKKETKAKKTEKPATPVKEAPAKTTEAKKSKAMSDKVKYTAPVATSDEEVYQVVDEMPVYADGQEAMMKYIGSNVQYPETAKKLGVEATVYVSFVVMKDGRLAKAKVLKAVDKPMADAKKVKDADLKLALDEMSREALRVVGSLPGKWQPGKQNGKAVSVAFTLPIRFALN